MKLSSRTEYGVRAMIELAEAHGGGPVAVREVAEKQGISEKYLEQLFAALRKEGLIASQRGAQGGHTLAKAPGDIRVGDIVRALEGPIALCDCLANGEDDAVCHRMGECAAHPLWVKLQDGITSILDSTTLQDMIAGASGDSANDMGGNSEEESRDEQDLP